MSRELIVVAHPDDETAGLGMRLTAFQDPVIVYTTDGAPYDLKDAKRGGFASRNAYSAARFAELERALRVAGIRIECTRRLAYVDKESWRDMASLTQDLRTILLAERPEVVYTHPYEGGHPDHDAAAFAVRSAVALTADVPVREFASYYSDENGQMVTGGFVSGFAGGEEALDERALERKRRMVRCFVSQRETLSRFRPELEPVRDAPLYDFTKPPCARRILYESWGWAMTNEMWRDEAARARRTLGLC